MAFASHIHVQGMMHRVDDELRVSGVLGGVHRRNRTNKVYACIETFILGD